MSSKFTLVKDLPADLKGAPQMILILKTLAKNGIGVTITAEELTKQSVAAGLVTRQPPERIIGYYTKPISELGDFVKVEKVTATPKAKAPAAVAGADASAPSGVAKPGKPAAAAAPAKTAAA